MSVAPGGFISPSSLEVRLTESPARCTPRTLPRTLMTMTDSTKPASISAGGAPSLMGDPTDDGRFGEFGGRYVPETLVPACEELEASFASTAAFKNSKWRPA